jgi:hypothetical protein
MGAMENGSKGSLMNGRSLFCHDFGGVAFSLALACGAAGCNNAADDAPAGMGGAPAGGAAMGGATTGGASGTSSGGTAMGGASTGGSSSGSSSGGSSSGGGGGTVGASGAASGGVMGRPPDVPPGESQMDIANFVKSGAYKSAPWISETAAPRAGGLGSQHRSTVRVWENPTLVNSFKAGHDGLMGHPYPDQWSMAVKELYDDAGAALVGTAVAFKTLTSPGSNAWIYYCVGPNIRCNSTPDPTEANPIYGNGMSTSASECGFCHGGLIFTKPP